MSKLLIRTITFLFVCNFITACSGFFYYPDRNFYEDPKKLGIDYDDHFFKSLDGTKLNAWHLKRAKKFKKSKGTIVINFNFFKQPNEIVLRSLSSLISKTNKKYYYPRGKTVLRKIFEIRDNSFKKTTLGGCIIERVNDTMLIYPENIK